MQNTIENAPSAQSLTGNLNGQNVNLRRITVDEYDAMIENGVFDENDKVELLNGAIVEKMPKGPKHSAATYRIAKIFFKLFDNQAIVRVQDPIWLRDFSEPEPDIVLSVLEEDEYEDSHPTPDEIYLILEVSDSTLGYDRNAKKIIYAQAGIRQYLIVNVQDKTVEDYREPGADGFQSKQTYSTGNSFDLVAFPEISLSVDDFFVKGGSHIDTE